MADISQIITKPYVIVEPDGDLTAVHLRNAPHLAHLSRKMADPFKAIEFAQTIWIGSRIPLLLMPISALEKSR